MDAIFDLAAAWIAQQFLKVKLHMVFLFQIDFAMSGGTSIGSLLKALQHLILG